jgi:CxxC-x17-CxxC domain-containing protein
MTYEEYRDRILTCRDCGQDFTFTAGEQEFYARKGLTNTPSRCPSCRAARRGGQSSGRSEQRESYETTCATCGRPTSVPFIPREDRPVYCSDCFQAQRASRPRRDYNNNYAGSSYNSGGGYGDRGGSGGGGRDRRGGGDRRSGNRW